MDLKVDGFTISYSFEGNSGKKSSNFVSVNFKLPIPVNVNELDSVRLEASKKVTLWAVQDAVLRGEISQEEARSRVEILRHNFDGMKDKYQEKE